MESIGKGQVVVQSIRESGAIDINIMVPQGVQVASLKDKDIPYDANRQCNVSVQWRYVPIIGNDLDPVTEFTVFFTRVEADARSVTNLHQRNDLVTYLFDPKYNHVGLVFAPINGRTEILLQRVIQ